MKKITLNEIYEIQPSVGAPSATVISNQFHMYLIYYENETNDGNNNSLYHIAVIKFANYWIYKFGFPGDESVYFHPFVKYGLNPYSAYVLNKSPWIDEQIKMGKKHPEYKPFIIEGLKHYIISFHDSTFECIARDFSLEKRQGKIKDVIEEIAKNL